MRRTRGWRRWAALVTAAGLVALLGGAAELRQDSEAVLPRAAPRLVWDLLADFSLTAELIPGLLEFKVVEENSDRTAWKYTVNYSSHASWWPHPLASSVAHYTVPHGHHGQLVVRSTHRTCYFLNFCLWWHSETQLSPTAGGDQVQMTLVREHVRYQCPRALSAACRSHVRRDRAVYVDILKMKFS